GIARLILEAPVVARGGDRFVVRALSPAETIGGGMVLDPIPSRRKSTWPALLNSPAPEARLEALAIRRPDGVPDRELPILLGIPADRARDLAKRSGKFRLVEDHWIRTVILGETSQQMLAVLERYHAARPTDPGMPLGEMRQTLHAPPWVVEATLGDLESGKKILRSDGFVRLSGFAHQTAGGNGTMERLISLVEKAGLTPPSSAELADALDLDDVGPILRQASKERRLEAVERDRHYSPGSLDQFVSVLRELGQAGPITPGRLRDRLGLSRKFLIPLLEWADSKGVTVRVDEGRKLR
ncbi:MAG: SelB C-terminal domain-containing protein, partial [Gemmatimonadota bacterium]